MRMLCTLILFAFSFPAWAQDGQRLSEQKAVDSLFSDILRATDQNHLEEASLLLDAAYDSILMHFGTEHLNYTKYLFYKGHWYLSKNDAANAEKFYLETKEHCLQFSGIENEAYGNTLMALGAFYHDQGDLEKAEVYLKEAQALIDKLFGKESDPYARVLNRMVQVFEKQGKYSEAEEIYLTIKSIRERTPGKNSPEYCGSIINLASFYDYISQLDKAEAYFLEAKSIFEEKIENLKHPYYISLLNNLGIHYGRQGKYEYAEPVFKKAMELKKESLGADHPNYAVSAENLATLYRLMGRYEDAEILSLKGLAIKEKVLGKNHPGFMASMINLAHLYSSMGQYEKSEQLNLQSLAYQRESIGTDNLEYAKNLERLALIYQYQKRYSAADSLLAIIIHIQEKKLGKNTNDAADTYGIWANVKFGMGDYDQALFYHSQALAIREKTLGDKHPFFVGVKVDMGATLLKKGDFEKSARLLKEARETLENHIGQDHPFYLNCLNVQTDCFLATEDYQSAAENLKIAHALQQKQLLNASNHLSESELVNFSGSFVSVLDQSLSLAFHQFQAMPSWVGDCLDQAIFHKGFLLLSYGRMRQLAKSDPQSTQLYNLLKSKNRLLEDEYSKPIPDRDSVLIALLEEKSNDLEKELVRTVRGFGSSLEQVTWRDIQQTLSEKDALVEFVHFRFRNPFPTDSILYAAIILTDQTEYPVFIPLFEERSLDSILQTQPQLRADFVNDLYSLNLRGASSLDKKRKTLYQMIWSPLMSFLENKDRIFITPTGLLHRINLGAIPIDFETVLSDKFQIALLQSSRTLAAKPISGPYHPEAVLFGGIVYALDSIGLGQLQANVSQTQGQFRSSETLHLPDEPDNRGYSWNYLPWTEKEILSISKICEKNGMQVRSLDGLNATEETFFELGTKKPSPRIIHLATHGFFFPDPKFTKARESPLSTKEPVIKASDNPMMRAGLIMAGGNHAWTTGKPPVEGLEDGILTAYEISQTDLSETELVVLSACETGLGAINGTEGVYGLQRAFKIAGTKYIIMALWQVPDRQTSLLMTEFYGNWLDKGQTIPEAFHHAQKTLREIGLAPYQWAGFVLLE